MGFQVRHSSVCCTWKLFKSVSNVVRLDLITTAPSVVYNVPHGGDGYDPIRRIPARTRDRIEGVRSIGHDRAVGCVGTPGVANQRRGEFIDMTYLSETRTSIKYDMPLAEVVTNYFDEMKFARGHIDG